MPANGSDGRGPQTGLESDSRPRPAAPPGRGVGPAVRAVLVVAAIAVFSAGAVFGLGQLHRVTAEPVSGERAAASDDAQRVPGVLVTRDYGASTLASGGAGAPGCTVMAALQEVASVETAYGGGFVDSIDGLASGSTAGGEEQSDWFYYVNGLLASRGAGDYRLRAGERVWWDFHRWSSISAPAVVGQYPEPFVGGHDGRRLPTVIVYSAGFAPDAEKLAASLESRGAESVRTVALTGSFTPPADTHVVLVGAYPQLVALDWLAEAAPNPAAAGLFATFSAAGTRAVSVDGGVRDLPAAGAVLATARGDAPGVAIWLVTGSSDDDARRAVTFVAERPAGLAGLFGVLVPRAGPARPLPLESR